MSIQQATIARSGSSKPTGELSVPKPALWLGASGALPFVACAIASLAAPELLAGQATVALIAYGAVILSFLGGVHWGMAIAIAGPGWGQSPPARRLIVSVIPSLVAWAALLVAVKPALYLLAVSFLAMLFIDMTAARQAEAPGWYPRLRLPLTLTVVASLIAAALA